MNAAMANKSSLAAFPLRTQYMFYNDHMVMVALCEYPTAPGQTQIVFKGENPDLFSLERSHFVSVLLRARDIAIGVQSYYKVRRCALLTEGEESIAIIPLHGLKETWEPVVHAEKEFNETYPGYTSSKDGPQMELARLDQICSQIQRISGLSMPFDPNFKGDATDQNLFARLIRCELPQHRVWEDAEHVAFLTPFANTPGFTVLVPRSHLPSDIFSINEEPYSRLVEAAFTVANILRKAFGVSHCSMIFEGFEIDYAHAKLIPIHNSPTEGNEAVGIGLAKGAEFQEKYKGYVTSMKGPFTKSPDLRRQTREIENSTLIHQMELKWGNMRSLSPIISSREA